MVNGLTSGPVSDYPDQSHLNLISVPQPSAIAVFMHAQTNQGGGALAVTEQLPQIEPGVNTR